MAVKQGNQLQMQVHEGYHVVDKALPPVITEKRPVSRTGKKPLAHYSSLVRVLGSDMKSPEGPAKQVRREWKIFLHFLGVEMWEMGGGPCLVMLQGLGSLFRSHPKGTQGFIYGTRNLDCVSRM